MILRIAGSNSRNGTNRSQCQAPLIFAALIHIATVHHKSPAWIGIQLEQLRRLSLPYRTYASLEGIDSQEGFDVVVPSLGNHSGKLNLLANSVLEVADRDDWLLFLDGDAFPIVDVVPMLNEVLGRSPLVAIRRDENLADRQPHPSFCATTAGFLSLIHI